MGASATYTAPGATSYVLEDVVFSPRPSLPSSSLADSVDLEYYSLILSKENGVDFSRYWRLVKCESGWKHWEENGELHMGDSGLAYGLLQFHWGTFYGFAKKYNLDYDIHDPYNQVDLSLRMIRDGYLGHWTCAALTGWTE